MIELKKILTGAALMLGLVCMSHSDLMGQDYQSAAGVRLGYPLSASYKVFTTPDAAFEGVLGLGTNYSSGNALTIALFYEKYKPIDVERLQWYYGFGPSVAFWSSSGLSNINLGIHGLIGLDYSFEEIPPNLSLDLIPGFYFKVSGYNCTFCGGYRSFGGLSVRYILN